MSILEVIGAITQIREAVSSMKREEPRQEFGYPNEHFARVGHALSDIYFSDQGILAVLRKIVAEEKLTEEDEERLLEFNQREEPVRNALEKLVLDHGRKARNSIKQSAIIGQLRGRKSTLRNAVQIAINEAITFNYDVNIDEVARLVAEIEALNRDIQDAEHALRRYV